MAHMFQRIRCDEVTIGTRHRKDFGELEVFAHRIKERGGLFQPIVVKRAGKYYKLLAGERRFRAVRDALHEAFIPAVIVEANTKLDELLFERDENDTHKPFNPIEAASLGKEIEEELGNRRGQRTDLAPNGARLGKTTEIAAEAVGFESEQAYRRAKTVVEHGAKELQDAVSDGTVSVSDAAAVAEAPKADQKQAVTAVREGKAKTVRQAISQFAKADEEDPEDEPTIDDDIKTKNSMIESFCREAMKLVEEMPRDVWLDDMGRRDAALQKFKDGCSTLRSAKCHAPCPRCDGAGCTECKETGRVPKLKYDQLV
jgi:ParB-like chromosome segregation protein Spo0J